MTEWKVEFHDRFKSEIKDLPTDVRIELLAHLVLLREAFDWEYLKSTHSKAPNTRT